MDPIKTFIRQPIFTAMLVMAVVVFGIFAYPKIGVDQFPDVDFPVVTVISDPLEEALNTLSGVETLRSVNVESVSQIVVQFSLDKNVNIAAQDVRDRVQATLSKLPKEAEAPVVAKFDIGAAPILTLAVSGPLPIQEMTRLAKDVVKPALQRKQGVGGIDLVGGQEREIQVVVEPGLLRSYGVSISDVTQALRAQSVDIPGGRTSEPGAERVVKLEGEVRSVDALRNLIIASPAGAPVRIRDVANVVDGPEEARSGATFEGQRAVALVVRKQSGSNTVQVAHDVMESMGEITALLPKGVKVATVTDGSKFIRSSISAVQEDMVLGGSSCWCSCATGAPRSCPRWRCPPLSSAPSR
jgi:HAE1 family hydrophobic/amphiphilic exporter-1